MSEHMMPIPSRVYNAAVGGHVCGPEDVDFGQKVIHLVKYDRSGNEVSFESQVTQANKIYVIHDDFTLSSNVTIPANCVLEFDGGSISGAYTITGNNTSINAGLVKIFNTSVSFAGTWNISETYPIWFGAVGDGVVDDTISLHNAMKICNTVSFKSGATYLICPNCDVPMEGVKTLYTMRHDLYIKGNRSTMKFIDNLSSFGGSYAVILGPSWPDYSFKCENLTVDWNDEGNSTYSYQHNNDQRMFYHGDRNYQVEIRNCHFIYYSITAVWAVMTREASIIDNCIFEYKHDSVQFDNSALRVAPNWNGVAKVTRCHFRPYNYTPELNEHHNMIGGIELHGLGTAFIEDNVFENVPMSINMADGHCARWNTPTRLEDFEKMIGTKFIRGNLYVNCTNAVALWSTANCLNNIVVDNNEVRLTRISAAYTLPTLVATAHTDTDILPAEYGGYGKLTNISITNNRYVSEVDWSSAWSTPINPPQAFIHICSKYVENIEISGNIIDYRPNVVIAIGYNSNVSGLLESVFKRVSIVNNKISNSFSTTINEGWEGHQGAISKTITIDFANNKLNSLDIMVDGNIIKHNNTIGYPMAGFNIWNTTLNSAQREIIRNGLIITDNNDIDHMPYNYLSGNIIIYKKYQKGDYNNDELFRLSGTKDRNSKNSYLEEYSTVDYFTDSVSQDTTISITGVNPFANVPLDKNNTNLQRGIYKTGNNNRVMIINSNGAGTLWEAAYLIYSESTVTEIIKQAPVYV